MTAQKPTSALWNRLADARACHREDLDYYDSCMRDLHARTRDYTAWNTRPWILARIQRFVRAEEGRIMEAAAASAASARNY